MYSYAQPRAFSATALLYAAAVLRTGAYRLRAAARRLDTWIARRQTKRLAVRALQEMSYLELRDIGLTGFDVQHLAWGGKAPGRPWQDAAETDAATSCESWGAEAEDVRELDGLAHLDVHVLKDIGAPQWLVARAAGERDREHLRWSGFDN